MDWLSADIATVVGVGINGSGKVVKGGGTTGIIGVIVLTQARKAREIVDIMQHGEIVEFDFAGPAHAAFAPAAPGIPIYANATTGVVSASAATGAVMIGHTCEKGRLIVNVRQGAAA